MINVNDNYAIRINTSFPGAIFISLSNQIKTYGLKNIFIEQPELYIETIRKFLEQP